MKEILWSKTLSVEVDEVDEDHRRLVELFNLLNHAVAEGSEPDYVEALLDELISCTVWHFKHEERLMLRYRYAGAAAHKQEHAELIESAGALREKFQRADKRLTNEDIEFLDRWLTEHILVTDMPMGAFLAQAM